MTQPQRHDDGPDRMPTTVLLLVLTFALITLAALIGAAGNAHLDRTGPAVLLGSIAATAAVTSIGLWRRWKPARYLAAGHAALIAVVMLRTVPTAVIGFGIGGGIIWSLNRPESRWWLERIRPDDRNARLGQVGPFIFSAIPGANLIGLEVATGDGPPLIAVLTAEEATQLGPLLGRFYGGPLTGEAARWELRAAMAKVIGRDPFGDRD